MDMNFYRFHTGQFECVSLLDGSMDYPLQNVYANIPREQVEEALRQHHLPVELVTTPYTYLYVNTGKNQVLVDMGAGDLGPSTGHLVQSMQAAGIDPSAIDTVIITHAHPDHIGGTLDDQGRPIYTHAHYYIAKDEWSFWFSETAPTKVNQHFIEAARKNLEPVKDRVILVDHEGEWLPGVTLIPAPGHTPGHMVAAFHSEGQTLMYIGDTVIQPLHLEQPTWLPIYDIIPEKAATSKQRIFDQATEHHYLVLGQHFPPFPSLGYVTRRDSGWLWEPIKLAG